jgi:hypothetical protein
MTTCGWITSEPDSVPMNAPGDPKLSICRKRKQNQKSPYAGKYSAEGFTLMVKLLILLTKM